MSEPKKSELSYTIFLSGPKAGELVLKKIQVVLFTHKKTQPKAEYTQTLEDEILFLWKYCPFHEEKDFASLVLHYIFSENRISQKTPFKKVHVITDTRTYHIDAFRLRLKVEETKFGKVDTLFENALFGVYRLRIAPGSHIPKHFHKVMEEKEKILTEGIDLDGKRQSRGAVHIWKHKESHFYENKSNEEQSILCIDQPPFDPKDEILSKSL